MSSSDRFQRLRAEFHALLDLAPPLREVRFDALAREEPALRQELEALFGRLDEADLAPTRQAMRPGERIGPFAVVRHLGSGGMGEVFLAERIDGGFAQQVALKILRPGALAPVAVRRFERERQILARLAHPTIAHLLDGGLADDGRPWLAMEYVDGQPVARWCEQHASSLRARIALWLQVCDAVQFAHGHLIVHRDIKPANVLVDGQGRARLLDFGIAKLLDDTESGETRAGLVPLTLRYAAPEQVSGDRTTIATDVHALGVVLYELLTGHSPYERAERGEIGWTQAVIGEMPSPLRRRFDPAAMRLDGVDRRLLRGDLERILMRALAKAPEQRYPSVAMLADDLRDCLAQRPLRSGIGSAREQTRLLLQRYRWPLASAAAVMLALGIGLLMAWREAGIARANEQAVLAILASAGSNDYTGREPLARDLLRAAAKEIELRHADNPGLQHRALGEIGHALVNLDDGAHAEHVLLAAVAAADRDGASSVTTRLGLLKLLCFAQDAAPAQARLRQTVERIEALATDRGAPVAPALDALASAASALSRQGEFARAEQVLARVDAMMHDDAPPPSVAENVERQRAFVALRADRAADARDALSRARALVARHPDAFSALRRAELSLLSAEAALMLGDVAAAAALLDPVLARFRDEYGVTHPQRTNVELTAARLRLAQGDFGVAQAALATAERGLAAAPAADSERLRLLSLQAAGAARAARCADAAASLASANALLQQPALQRMPRNAEVVRVATTALDRFCAAAVRP